MNNINYIILDGNLTRDPELRQTSNSMVCNFAIAVNYTYKDQNQVSFFNIETWGRLAETCSEYLRKGSKITVQGELRQKSWKDQEGKNQSQIYILANTVRFDSIPHKER